ncbi:hypothetical protein ACOXXX_12170 [Thalassococcus sp. BH17M4-6]|uniref:hypothetical protein n=1 Tax=Thalassococcus sp. BH17M4-6 TaxID=3413148 RepID=UPI003BE50381
MTKTYAIAAAMTCLAAAAWATTEVLVPEQPTVIEIEVSAAELAECQDTLRAVAQQPAVHDNGSPVFFDFSSDLPTVKCVVSAEA